MRDPRALPSRRRLRPDPLPLPKADRCFFQWILMLFLFPRIIKSSNPRLEGTSRIVWSNFSWHNTVWTSRPCPNEPQTRPTLGIPPLPEEITPTLIVLIVNNLLLPQEPDEDVAAGLIKRETWGEEAFRKPRCPRGLSRNSLHTFSLLPQPVLLRAPTGSAGTASKPRSPV